MTKLNSTLIAMLVIGAGALAGRVPSVQAQPTQPEDAGVAPTLPPPAPAPVVPAQPEPIPEPLLDPVPVPGPAPISEPAPGEGHPQPVAPHPEVEPAPTPATEKPATEKPTTEKPKKAKGELSWKGRVFVGNVLSRREVADTIYWRNRHGVNSARMAMTYRHPAGLKARVKVEFGDGRAKLKDGYIRLDLLDNMKLQAGRFKRQMSNIALTSRWDLPSIERGLLSTLDNAGLPFSGGRGDGAMLRYELPLATKVRLSASLFRAEIGSTVVIDPRDHLAEDYYLRASVEPIAELQLASSLAFIGYLDSPGDATSFDHAPMLSLEATYFGKHLRAWAEAFYGRSTVVSLRNAKIDGEFAAARVLVAPRFRPGTPRRLVPFVGASYLDPARNTSTALNSQDDSNFEGQVGVNLAFTKIWRLQLEVAHTLAQGDFSLATDGTVFRIQLGANFED